MEAREEDDYHEGDSEKECCRPLCASAEDELKEDKQTLRESLRLERVADEEEARLEKVETENQARLSRVENLLQRVRTELTDGDDANDKVTGKETGEVSPKKIGSKATAVSAVSTTSDPNAHECQKCGQHLPEASIELWEHYTNHYTETILRFLKVRVLVFFHFLEYLNVPLSGIFCDKINHSKKIVKSLIVRDFGLKLK